MVSKEQMAKEKDTLAFTKIKIVSDDTIRE
jgi:hypothetical protein